MMTSNQTHPTPSRVRQLDENIPTVIDFPSMDCTDDVIRAAFRKYRQESCHDSKLTANRSCVSPARATHVRTLDDSKSDEARKMSQLRRNVISLRKQWSQSSLQSYAMKSAVSLNRLESKYDIRAHKKKRCRSTSPLRGGHNASFDLSTTDYIKHSSCNAPPVSLSSYYSDSDLSSISDSYMPVNFGESMTSRRPSTGFKQVATLQPPLHSVVSENHSENSSTVLRYLKRFNDL